MLRFSWRGGGAAGHSHWDNWAPLVLSDSFPSRCPFLDTKILFPITLYWEKLALLNSKAQRIDSALLFSRTVVKRGCWHQTFTFNPNLTFADIVTIPPLSTTSLIFFFPFSFYFIYLKKSRAKTRFRTSQTSVAFFCLEKLSARFCANSFLFMYINYFVETSILQRALCVTQWSTGFLQRAELINTLYSLACIRKPCCFKHTVIVVIPESFIGMVI